MEKLETKTKKAVSRTYSLNEEQINAFKKSDELWNEFKKLIEDMPVLTSTQAFKEAERRCNENV